MMIDLEKENKLFAEYNMREPHSPDEECELVGWIARAELADAEEAKLQAQITELQQKLARYENPDYVLVPRNPTNSMVGEAQGASDRMLYHYEVSGVWHKMIETMENDNERH